MNITVPVAQPFSFAQTLAFLRRFAPCQHDYVLGEDSLVAAVTVAGRAVPFTLRQRGTDLICEVPDALHALAVAARAADFVGARDDVAELYRRADGDAPFQQLIRELHGLHHVRFLTLEEISVYCVLMQRTPVRLAATYKRRFFERFATPIEVGGHTLRALPEFPTLVQLEAADIAEAIGHARKAEQIVDVVRGVAALGHDLLATAPYNEARDALLAIRGIGPFSAAAILLRGLGRMDELPLSRFSDEARALYGAVYDEPTVARRYGDLIGYWSFYLKTGIARRAGARRPPRRAAR